MESVDILRGIHGQQNFLCIDVRRQGQLHQDAVDLIPPVQVGDQRQQLIGGLVSGNACCSL